MIVKNYTFEEKTSPKKMKKLCKDIEKAVHSRYQSIFPTLHLGRANLITKFKYLQRQAEKNSQKQRKTKLLTDASVHMLTSASFPRHISLLFWEGRRKDIHKIAKKRALHNIKIFLNFFLVIIVLNSLDQFRMQNRIPQMYFFIVLTGKCGWIAGGVRSRNGPIIAARSNDGGSDQPPPRSQQMRAFFNVEQVFFSQAFPRQPEALYTRLLFPKLT